RNASQGLDTAEVPMEVGNADERLLCAGRCHPPDCPPPDVETHEPMLPMALPPARRPTAGRDFVLQSRVPGRLTPIRRGGNNRTWRAERTTSRWSREHACRATLCTGRSSTRPWP